MPYLGDVTTIISDPFDPREKAEPMLPWIWILISQPIEVIGFSEARTNTAAHLCFGIHQIPVSFLMP